MSTRERIFEYIQKNPGAHFRKIQRSLEIGVGQVQYHLYQMERKGLIWSNRNRIFKQFFAKEKVSITP